jgi:hypothetical protein
VALDPNSSVRERFGADVIQKRDESSRRHPRLSLVSCSPCQITKRVIGKRKSRISGEDEMEKGTLRPPKPLFGYRLRRGRDQIADQNKVLKRPLAMDNQSRGGL